MYPHAHVGTVEPVALEQPYTRCIHTRSIKLDTYNAMPLQRCRLDIQRKTCSLCRGINWDWAPARNCRVWLWHAHSMESCFQVWNVNVKVGTRRFAQKRSVNSQKKKYKTCVGGGRYLYVFWSENCSWHWLTSNQLDSAVCACLVSILLILCVALYRIASLFMHISIVHIAYVA